MKKHSFTLIELLVVITIIAILAGILLPLLSSSKDRAKAIICVSNLKQIGTSFELYSNSYDGMIPPIDPAAEYSGAADNLLRDDAGKYRGIGLFIETLKIQPKIFSCPLNKKARDNMVKQAYDGTGQVQSAFLYRQNSGEDEAVERENPELKTSNLDVTWGDKLNLSRSVLVDDARYDGSDGAAENTNAHYYKEMNVLKGDGHVVTFKSKKDLVHDGTPNSMNYIWARTDTADYIKK